MMNSIPMSRALFIAAVSVLLSACGDGAREPLPPTQPGAKSIGFVVEPSRTEGTLVIAPSPQVVIRDQAGNRDVSTTNAVTITLGVNPSGSTLKGTTVVNAIAGVATFGDLSLDRPGGGHTLVALVVGYTSATSAAFQIILTFSSVSAGTGHTCARTVAGATYCWGLNSAGQLGNGTTINSSTPARVSELTPLNLAAVSTGSNHTCGLTSAGLAYCWGFNDLGQLGDGTTASKATPVVVSSPPGLSFSTISAGFTHTCAVTPGGDAYCWGDNSYGQLGVGTLSAGEPAPQGWRLLQG